jgi:hypothetical protein
MKAGLFGAGVLTAAGVVAGLVAAPATAGQGGGPPPSASPDRDQVVEAKLPNAAFAALHQQVKSQQEANFLNAVTWYAYQAKVAQFAQAVEHFEAAQAAQAAASAAQAAAAAPAVSAPSSVAGTMACIRNAESGDNYSAVNASTGAGGAYQFMPSTWAGLGGAGLPEDASPGEQDAMAYKLYQEAGWSPWAGDPCV